MKCSYAHNENASDEAALKWKYYILKILYVCEQSLFILIALMKSADAVQLLLVLVMLA